MKRLLGVFVICTIFLGIMGLGFAQDSATEPATEEPPPPVSFELVSELGRALPRNMLYNPPMDQYLIVDAYSRMTLMDAPTFTTRHVIYESGNYADFTFSNDGKLLAIAIENRIELWDTLTGQRVARLTELGQPQQIVAPISFSRDDSLLIFEGVYPAPRAIRTFEGQTITVPWLWHIPSALGVNTSNFPGRAEAWQFYDYTNGLVIAPDNRLVAALPSRLQVLDAGTLEVLFEIPTTRYENDPMVLQFSARDNQLYFRPNNSSRLVQIDTQRGVLTEIPMSTALTQSDLELLGGIQLSSQARRIGEGWNDLVRALLGERLENQYDSGEITITLIDLIVPPITQGDNIRALLFVYNEDKRLGYFELTSGGAQQMILNPDGSQITLRHFQGNNERITSYNLNTGQQEISLIPSLRGIGAYNRIGKNRVLAFDTAGQVLISDFQRYDANTGNVIVEDLSYSRRFDNFFIAPDNRSIVTVSGNEWRVWDTTTRQVIRREVLSLSGSLIGVAPDGYRWLTLSNSLYEVIITTIHPDTITTESLSFDSIPVATIGRVVPNRDWTRFLVIYSGNPFGQYTPGNEIAAYSMEEGKLWHIAGDDLPPPNGRNYGWVDDDTVFVTGTGFIGEQPERVYGIDYDHSRLPRCIVEAFPEQIEEWSLLWENRLYYMRSDQLHQLATLICRENPQTPEQVLALLEPTPILPPMTVTPNIIQGVPVCLTLAYANDLEDYVAIWNNMVSGLNAEQLAEMETVVCEGLGNPQLPLYRPENDRQRITQTMFIEASSGERSTGAFIPEQRTSRPLQPVIEAFQRQYNRAPGQIVLSQDGNLIATSNLPGELIVYRLIDGYEQIMVNVTATSVAIQQARNWVYPQPSATPQFEIVGTPRPTLTPTTVPTMMPTHTLLQVNQAMVVENLCPSETLYTPDRLPEGWSPEGTIATQIQDDILWRIDPMTGSRFPDETIPQCFEGIDCSFSTDKSWILANTADATYVIRPDGTDSRGLWDAKDMEDGLQDYPFLMRPSLSWWNSNTLQWRTSGYNENGVLQNYINRDILGVFPDPDPIVIQNIVINGIVAERVMDISASVWSVARIPFSTGTSIIYQYYLYNTETAEWVMFARVAGMGLAHDGLGTRLFYTFQQVNRQSVWNQIMLDTVSADGYQANRLSSFGEGIWSLRVRYRISATGNSAYPIQLWDSQQGIIRNYCIPETGARLYGGGFLWSPDHRYVALRAPLPKDEADEGVGQHLLVLDIETGAIVDVTTGISSSMFWIAESYE